MKNDMILKTGRAVEANCGLISINSDFSIREGYDGYIHGLENWTDNPYTKEEKIELADYMIGLWTQYKELK